jgi:hypothetical protein
MAQCLISRSHSARCWVCIARTIAHLGAAQRALDDLLAALPGQ